MACCSRGGTTRLRGPHRQAFPPRSARLAAVPHAEAESPSSILNYSYARIRADGYFAVTTTLWQVGSQRDVLRVQRGPERSGHAGFDRADPFLAVPLPRRLQRRVLCGGVRRRPVRHRHQLTLGAQAVPRARAPLRSRSSASRRRRLDFHLGKPRETRRSPIRSSCLPVLSGEYTQIKLARPLPAASKPPGHPAQAPLTSVKIRRSSCTLRHACRSATRRPLT